MGRERAFQCLVLAHIDVLFFCIKNRSWRSSDRFGARGRAMKARSSGRPHHGIFGVIPRRGTAKNAYLGQAVRAASCWRQCAPPATTPSEQPPHR
jgi:hypothetical protein